LDYDDYELEDGGKTLLETLRIYNIDKTNPLWKVFWYE